jgi:hypothetical protein
MTNASETIETDARPALDNGGAMDAIEKTVRLCAARIFPIRPDFHAGVRPRDPLPLIETEARSLSVALAFTVRQRSVFMVQIPDDCKTFGDPATALGMWLTAQLVTGAQELEDGRMAEPEFKRRLDVAIATVLDRLKY